MASRTSRPSPPPLTSSRAKAHEGLASARPSCLTGKRVPLAWREPKALPNLAHPLPSTRGAARRGERTSDRPAGAGERASTSGSGTRSPGDSRGRYGRVRAMRDPVEIRGRALRCVPSSLTVLAGVSDVSIISFGYTRARRACPAPVCCDRLRVRQRIVVIRLSCMRVR